MVCCVILTTLDVSLFYLKVQEKAFFVIVYEKKMRMLKLLQVFNFGHW